MMPKETLISMQQQRREKEHQDRLKKQNKEMKKRQMDLPQRQYNQSTSSTADIHMADALAKVREQDDVSIPHSLARLHGTTIYHKPDRG